MNLSAGTPIDSSRVFVTKRSRLESRWDPNFYRCMKIFRAKIKGGAFPLEKLDRSLALVQYGISERATEEPVGVPMLRMINLQSDTWDVSDLKYIEMANEEKKPYLLQQGDLLFNRTNSKELVGKCNVFDLAGEYVFASYLIRVRLRQDGLLPEYVTAFFSSSLGRIQIDAVSRQIAGMTNINAEEIRNLEIPALDRTAQGKVVKAWKAAIQRRDETLESARKILDGIDDVLLAELGLTPKPAVPNTIKNRIFNITFEQLTGQRLDPLYHLGDMFSFIRDANCDLLRLGDLTIYFLTGFAAGRDEQSDDDDGIVQIRPTNLSNDCELVFHRNVKIASSESNNRKADLLRRGEVLFNNTNSQEQVGKTVYFDLDGPFFCSNHITRLGIRSDKLNPCYLAYVLTLYQRHKVFYKLCTNWNNQSGVGSDVLKRIPIPVPAPKSQIAIVTKLNGIRDAARKLRKKAVSELEQAKQGIDNLILGEEING